MDTVITFIIILGVLVFFHELGHLYFAKRAGILCREFAIGFGPKVFSFMKNETVYTLRLLPFGGFVRMAGKDDEMIELKPGIRVGLELNVNNAVTKIITNHLERYQDLKVIEIENADLNHQLIIQGYEENSEEIRTFSVYEKAMRDGKKKRVTVIPDLQKTAAGDIGKIGVSQPTEKAMLGAVSSGFTQTYQFTKQILVGVGQLITGKLSIDSLAGPVGIYTVTDEVAKSGILSLMNWAAILSINLGIMNLLPLPALDGGRLFFFAVEALRGKPFDQQRESIIHFIGLALLMLLMLVVTWNDIKIFYL